MVVTTSGEFNGLCSMTMGAEFGVVAVSAAFPFKTGVAGDA